MELRKFLLVTVLVALIVPNVAFAVEPGKVVYLLMNTNNAEPLAINVLEDMGFTVDVRDSDNILSLDMSEYQFMLLHDDLYSNWEDIPVNEFAALVVNSRRMDEWHWTSKISTKTSSQPIKGHINDPDHFITQGLSGDVALYTSSTPTLAFLHAFFKARDIDSVVSTDNQTTLNTLNAIIGTADVGTELRDGAVSETKSVFFGITDYDYWTSASVSLFERSALWLITDLIPPEIENLTVTDLTNHSATIEWETSRISNISFFYGTTTDTPMLISYPETLSSHGIELDNLAQDTTYYYRIETCNQDGFCALSDLFDFTTLDITAPHLGPIEATNITNSTAFISVEANELSTFTVYYGKGKSNLTNQAANGPFFQGTVPLFDLTERTQYAYVVEACDASFNCNNNSVQFFITLDLTAPYALNNSVTAITNQSATVIVATNELATATLYYGTNESDLSLFVGPSQIGEQATLEISGLVPLQTYYYLIEMCDLAANCRNTTINPFATLDLTAPYVIELTMHDLTNSSVTINALTDDEASASFWYGITEGVLDQNVSNLPDGTNFTVFLDGLQEKTTYYHAFTVCDEFDNCRSDAQGSFTTLDLTEPLAPQNLHIEVSLPTNIVTVQWDDASDDAAFYDVYVADSADGFNFSTPEITVTDSEYVDLGAAIIDERYYVVRARDAAGNAEANTNVVGKHDLDLNAGNNLVSLPLIPFDSSIDEVMHQTVIHHPITEVTGYDASSGALYNATYGNGAWTGPLSSLEHGNGYFFNANQATTFTMVGMPPGTTELGLVEGLNLVGLSNSAPQNISTVIESAEADSILEIARRLGDGKYALSTYHDSEWHNPFVLERGQGYWVISTIHQTLVIE